MCELLGLSFDRSINAKFSFQGLLEGTYMNRSGWGVGLYPDNSGSALVLKEPIKGSISDLALLFGSYQKISSQIVIGHIRRASRGTISHDNTHPFNRFYCRREWLFAHNGTLTNSSVLESTLNTGKSMPIGGTDSERAFLKLLQELSNRRIRPIRENGEYQGFPSEKFPYIKDILIDIHNTAGGSFNCLFTEGRHLFCYRGRGSNNLYYIERTPPYEKAKIRDQELEIDFAREKSGERGYVIATEKLSDERRWKEFAAGELRVFTNGEMVLVN